MSLGHRPIAAAPIAGYLTTTPPASFVIAWAVAANTLIQPGATTA